MLMRHNSTSRFFALTLLLLIPHAAEAGPLLICHPFQTEGSPLLAWGSGPGWNTPDRSYDVRHLTADVLALLDGDAPVLARMENMRRAVIYATRDRHVAEALLTAIRARAETPGATRLAWFDAGYLIESYKQATHLFGRRITAEDGYAMVRRALNDANSPEMEFAAALMTQGDTASSHAQRARAAATAGSMLAKNMVGMGW
jgi:hypothetical protein